MAGFKFAIDIDTARFKRGTDEMADSIDEAADHFKDLEDSASKNLDKAADSFDDISDAAKDAGKDIDNKFTDNVEDASDEAKDLEKKYRDAFDGAADASRNAGDKIGKNVNDGFDKAKKGADEFKDEAKSTAREGAASFTGEFDDVSDVLQETMANALGGFGPAGAAAGMAAAAGLGVVFKTLQDTADKINDLKEEAGQLALEFKEAGGSLDRADLVARLDEWLVAIEDTKQAWEIWQVDAISNLDNMRVALDDTGISLGDLYSAFSKGDTSTLQAYVDKLKEVNEALVPEGHVANTQAQNDEYQARKNTISGLEDEIKKRKDAEDMAYEMRAAEEGVTEETLRQQDAIDGRNDALQESIDLNREVIDGELDYLDTLDSVTAKLAENATAGFDKNTAAGRENLRTLGEISSAALDYSASITEAGGSQAEANKVIDDGRTKVIEAGISLGMTKQQAEAYADSLGLIPKEVSTTAKANTSAAETALNNVTRDRWVTVQPQVNQAQWQAYLNQMARNMNPVTVQVNARTGNNRLV